MDEFTNYGMLGGLRDIFIKALKCNNPYEYSELIREWNEEIDHINKLCGFDYKNCDTDMRGKVE